MRHRPAVLLLAALVLAPVAPARTAGATAPVQRCIGADGRTIYTDRRCADLGAVDRLPAAPEAIGRGPHRAGCARTLSALSAEIGAAVRAGDVNRLSGVYDWSGVSNAAAKRILDRLDAVVARPLVDIAPVLAVARAPAAHAAEQPSAARDAVPEPPPAPPPAWQRYGARGAMSEEPAATPAATAAAEDAPDPRPARPVGLRLEQTLAGGATPVRTVFGLRRNFGCLWISL